VSLRLYADDPWLRTRQVVGDALVLVVGYWVVRIALRLREGVGELRVVATGLERSGRNVSQGADGAGDALQGVPGVGGALAAPFRTIEGAGRDLVASGEQIGRTVDAVALWLPLTLALLVLGWIGLRYLPARVTWVREATEVGLVLRSPDAARLLGMRAAATRPLRQLRRTVGDPATALAEERFAELAAVELRALGLSTAVLSAEGVPAGDAAPPG
jgi:hypothetical protein